MSRSFASIGEFVRFMAGRVATLPAAQRHALADGADIVLKEARAYPGTYQSGWTALQPETIAHKHARYSLAYTATFYPPGKHPGDPDAKTGEGEGAAPAPSADGVGGTADIAWDTAIVRSEPKGKEIVMRLVRGTRVKVLEKRDEWYKVDHRGKAGWVFRAAIGL